MVYNLPENKYKKKEGIKISEKAIYKN